MSTLGSAVLERNGMDRVGSEAVQPHPLHGCITLRVCRIVGLKIPVNPPAAGVTRCVPITIIIRALVIGSNGGVRKRRRCAQGGRQTRGCDHERLVRRVSGIYIPARGEFPIRGAVPVTRTPIGNVPRVISRTLRQTISAYYREMNGLTHGETFAADDGRCTRSVVQLVSPNLGRQ